MSKILVVGDAMMDVKLSCEVSRLSQEAPIPIYDVDDQEIFVGGAGNVARNIAAMGGKVTLLCAMGVNSPIAPPLTNNIELVTVEVRGTTIKQRTFVNDVMRVRIDQDYILDEDESEKMVDRFVDIFRGHDTVVFSDYNKGALRHVQDMIEHCRGKLTIVDPKGTNWNKYGGVSIIKGNATEVSEVYAERLSTARRLGTDIIIRTMGAGGSVATFADGRDDLEIPAFPEYAVDPTGAGDSYLAALAVALTRGDDLRTSMLRASVAGALATVAPGTYAIEEKDIESCLKRWLQNTKP